MSASSPAPAPRDTYQLRAARFAAERDALDRRSAANGTATVVLALAAVIALVLGVWRLALLDALAAALAGGAVVSYARNVRTDRALARARALVAINAEGPLRLARDWEHLPLRGDAPAPANHPYAGDLDVLGPASLLHLLNTAATADGQATLRAWLLAPAAPAAIARRQAAARELAPAIDLRQGIEAGGRVNSVTPAEAAAMLAWAETAPWLAARPWLGVARWVLPVPPIALALAQALGRVPYPLWVPFALLNLALMATAGRGARAAIAAVTAQEDALAGEAASFDLLTAPEFAAPMLRDLQARLRAGGLTAGDQTRRLWRIVPFATLRRWLFFPVVQAFTLWDLHLVATLDGWRAVAGSHLRDWRAALGEYEALAALATLAFDQPAWTFPTVTAAAAPEPIGLSARDLGHPLLPPERCVGNDVALGPPGNWLLVTGSNMSGKSTLLRAIGTNTVLAHMGGPVCARHFTSPAVRLATSMRVQDSLAQGVSAFMAELRRLKLVVDVADSPEGPPALYLLDEMLHGTNTRERQIAARRIIRHLLRQRAIGAVSTHDLTLADVPDLAAASQAVHFTESLARRDGAVQMTFDYRLRPGLATSSNALALLEMVGLDVGRAGDDLPDEG